MANDLQGRGRPGNASPEKTVNRVSLADWQRVIAHAVRTTGGLMLSLPIEWLQQFFIGQAAVL